MNELLIGFLIGVGIFGGMICSAVITAGALIYAIRRAGRG